jgi:UDP-N-acetylglucosamine:LPS N-acetylglucosamine transferase
VTDRGGHLSNALELVKGMSQVPDAIVTTYGPDIDVLKKSAIAVFSVPYLFSWLGKRRFLNPIGVVGPVVKAFYLAAVLRPQVVVSLGATNVVLFCYFSRLFGGKVFHVECMNQVVHPSVTGKLLYPICEELLVQWESLLSQFGPKARYKGWVLLSL